LRLQPFVHSITGVDNSAGMLNVFNSKIEKLKLSNVTAKLVDLEKGDLLEGQYQLVTSSMTLHHVSQVAELINRFFQMISPNGCLCVADLDLDHGQFHGDNTGVSHHGFDRAALHNVFVEAGFVNVREFTAAEIVKTAADGQIKPFTVFVMIGEKKGL